MKELSLFNSLFPMAALRRVQMAVVVGGGGVASVVAATGLGLHRYTYAFTDRSSSVLRHAMSGPHSHLCVRDNGEGKKKKKPFPFSLVLHDGRRVRRAQTGVCVLLTCFS